MVSGSPLPLLHKDLFSCIRIYFHWVYTRVRCASVWSSWDREDIIGESCRYGMFLKFSRCKGPELLSVYIGESEKNVRDIFQKVSQNDIDASIDDGADSAAVVEIDDFIKALAELSASLSLAELEKYEQLRDQFEGTRK